MGSEEVHSSSVTMKDPEQQAVADEHLNNSMVKNITWSGVTVTVKDRESKQPKRIVDDAAGAVEAGECCLDDLT
jgi:hypothetical protein